MDVEDWCFESNVSGKEVGNFIDVVTTLATKLLKIVEEKILRRKNNWEILKNQICQNYV